MTVDAELKWNEQLEKAVGRGQESVNACRIMYQICWPESGSTCRQAVEDLAYFIQILFGFNTVKHRSFGRKYVFSVYSVYGQPGGSSLILMWKTGF
jgi:hypothetical protein